MFFFYENIYFKKTNATINNGHLNKKKLFSLVKLYFLSRIPIFFFFTIYLLIIREKLIVDPKA